MTDNSINNNKRFKRYINMKFTIARTSNTEKGCGSYMKAPELIKNKKASIDVQNDDKCYLSTVLAKLHLATQSWR